MVGTVEHVENRNLEIEIVAVPAPHLHPETPHDSDNGMGPHTFHQEPWGVEAIATCLSMQGTPMTVSFRSSVSQESQFPDNYRNQK